MTVSFGKDADRDPLEPELIEEIFQDYAKFTGVEYAYGDQRHGEKAYYEDVVERATRGGSGRNQKNIDLIIVADQLLTGYDSKYINTLYVDRQLKLQNLIQAYSRTNRIFGKEKEFGSIINFMYPRLTEEMVKEALVLYGSGGKSSQAIVDPYNVAKRKFMDSIQQVENVLNDPTSWQSLQSDEQAKEKFLKAYREAKDHFNTIQQYYEYEWDNESFGVTEHEWMRYEGAFRNLTRDEHGDDELEEETPIFPLGETKLAGSQRIDAHYIIQLIEERATAADGKQTVDSDGLKVIYEYIEELSNLGEHEQAELLKQFIIEEVEQGKITVEKYFEEAYEEWKNTKLQAEIYDISKAWGMDEKVFERAVNAYTVSQSKDIPFMEEITASVDYDSIENPKTDSPLDHIIKMGQQLPDIVHKLNRKYRS
ncbi:MAG TPA: type I restriction endonuclease subunit R, partial [Bacillota bacterium]|nr:type I restriction endonuclease subunit R [Bacillota bacterium]